MEAYIDEDGSLVIPAGAKCPSLKTLVKMIQEHKRKAQRAARKRQRRA